MTAPTIVSLVHLGCARNLIDSELILARMAEEGCVIAGDVEDAEVAVLNTCSFIGPAREESEGAIRDLLDRKQRVLRVVDVSRGTLDSSIVHPREVFRRAIRESCSRLAIVHNHPSGDPTPSAADIACTKQLMAAGKVVGIELIDHVVVGGGGGLAGREYVSLRAEGMMAEE